MIILRFYQLHNKLISIRSCPYFPARKIPLLCGLPESKYGWLVVQMSKPFVVRHLRFCVRKR
jgi:hypothetical protein